MLLNPPNIFWIFQHSRNSQCASLVIGNGICDGDANIGGACEFDGGDCCQPIIDDSGCVNKTCLCYDDWSLHFNLAGKQKYTYRVLQTIQMKLILLCVWAEPFWAALKLL